MPGINPCADAAAHWAEAQKFDRLEFYKRHLALFGQCAFADFAKLKIEEKEEQLKSGTTAPEDAVKLATLPTQQPPAGTAPTTECDRLAADPEDGDRVAEPGDEARAGSEDRACDHRPRALRRAEDRKSVV